MLLRACTTLKCLPVSGFPVADVKAIDVRTLNARDDACCHWQTVLGAGFGEGAVCVCSDSVALWAVQLPQQQHQKTSSFIKHRLLSFPSCYRVHLGCPSAGRALIRATNESRCMEWWVLVVECGSVTIATATNRADACAVQVAVRAMAAARWPR